MNDANVTGDDGHETCVSFGLRCFSHALGRYKHFVLLDGFGYALYMAMPLLAIRIRVTFSLICRGINDAIIN
jgi:hypothetical protein